MNALGHHGLASGDDGVARSMAEYLLDNLFNRLFLPLGIPGGVFGVAPPATEITPGGSDKNRRNARQFSLALDGIKDLGDPHGWEGLGGSGPVST